MLSLRLQAIANLIKNDDVVADIGSDHGLLVNYLAIKGHRALYASENKKGPYNRLKSELKAYKSDIIEIDLADGLENLPARINTVVIAGMGGELIVSILQAYPAKLVNVQKLILAPHCNAKAVREVLNALNYSISYEEIVVEKEVFYEIIVAEQKAIATKEVNPYFGTYHLQARSENFIKMWTSVYNQNKRILSNKKLPLSRKEELLKEQELIEKVISEGEKV